MPCAAIQVNQLPTPANGSRSDSPDLRQSFSRGPVNPRTSSALATLPPELRIRILEYTDLVTPWKEVTWSWQHRGYRVVCALCTSSSLDSPPHNHSGCRLSSCDPNVHDGDCVPSAGCRHSAFSSSACNCWAPPTNLFLIYRTSYRDAQFAFFSRNRFIIHDFHVTEPWDLPAEQLEPGRPKTASTRTSYPFERLAVSKFLRDIVPVHCLAYLRFLELLFPPYVPHDWPHREHPAILDWAATVDWARGQVNAPALTIRLVMADFGAGAPIIGRRAMTKVLADDTLRGYAYIMQPLKPLVRGMAAAAWRASTCTRHIPRDGSWTFAGVLNWTTGTSPDCTETTLLRLSDICGAPARVPSTTSTGLSPTRAPGSAGIRRIILTVIKMMEIIQWY
ncbi:hypothetical protein N657DRAFT_648116 [Parathielavia appendiculata]|uniref:Uncharacterized protein n=1 Tax=Parathielavia appendiculata TaxID=2587402 RepID=A0AAN6TV34_9PEZI|nr:hypothetical protein N657DRAFT_648116 [Parathielavia appendiculata]